MMWNKGEKDSSVGRGGWWRRDVPGIFVKIPVQQSRTVTGSCEGVVLVDVLGDEEGMHIYIGLYGSAPTIPERSSHPHVQKLTVHPRHFVSTGCFSYRYGGPFILLYDGKSMKGCEFVSRLGFEMLKKVVGRWVGREYCNIWEYWKRNIFKGLCLILI